MVLVEELCAVLLHPQLVVSHAASDGNADDPVEQEQGDRPGQHGDEQRSEESEAEDAV